MLLVARVMDTVPATHENDSLRRRKHVLATDGAVTVHRSFDADVLIAQIHANADVADFAMEKVFARALADAADAAVVAVVDRLFRVVVPELAHVAVIGGGFFAAVSAVVGGGLGGSAEHAEHVSCLSPLQVV